jgi:hypothetical protein
VLTCHCTTGAGLPLAEAVNDTEFPAQTDLFVGLSVIAGSTLIVTAALPLPEFPQLASLTLVTV